MLNDFAMKFNSKNRFLIGSAQTVIDNVSPKGNL